MLFNCVILLLLSDLVRDVANVCYALLMQT